MPVKVQRDLVPQVPVPKSRCRPHELLKSRKQRSSLNLVSVVGSIKINMMGERGGTQHRDS